MAGEPAGLGIHVATTAKKHVPARKMSLSRQGVKVPEFEMIKPPDPVSQVVVHVAETRPSTSDSSRKSSMEGERRLRPRRPTITIPKKAHVPVSGGSVAELPAPPPARPIQHPPRSSSRSPADVPLPQSRNATPTPITAQVKQVTSPPPEETPVHRSVFPVFNPSIPLSQQPYQPNPALVPALTRLREVAQTSQQATSSNHDAAPPTAQATDAKNESLLRRSDSIKRPSGYSKSEELSTLWSLANGQPAEDALDAYNLELSCDDLSLSNEIITFSHTTAALYALTCSPTSISITRAHPISPSTRIECCSTSLSTPSRQDPLVASLFPKLAGLLALDESSNAAIARRLDRQGCSLLQASAIKAAQEKEAAMLLWDCDSGRYCVLHPTLLDNTATVMKISITPDPTNPTRITVFAPESDETIPLLSLDIPSLTLTINTPAITALPSLYILDTLVSALLTLLLHLHRQCAYPSSSRHNTPPLDGPTATSHISPTPNPNIPFFPPPPTKPNTTHRPSSAFRSLRSHRSNRSIAATSITAYDAEANNNYNNSSTDIELGVLDPTTGKSISQNGKQKRWFGHAKEGKHPKGKGKSDRVRPPPGLFDDKDSTLPAGTRAALKFLYWGFEVLFWFLGALVQILSAVVVGAGKFVQKL